MKILKTDILIPNDRTTDFCIDNKCTVIGWLQKIYLYPEDEQGYIPVNSPSHRQNYEKAINVLRKLTGLKTYFDLLDWESKINETKALSILKKIFNELKNEKKT